MVVLLVVALASVAVAPAAEAAFPGRNGVIAYTAPGVEVDPTPEDMWTVDPTSGATTQLTHLQATIGPAWSDDGRTLAFSLFTGRQGFVIAAVPGRRPSAAPWTFGDAEWMTLPAPTSPDPIPTALDYDPSWAPGGRRIVYHDAAGSLIILGSDDSKRVIATGATRDGPAWSPDGRLIAFSRCLPSLTRCSLWMVRPNGTALRPLTDGTMNASAPSWSPDGRQLVFEADGGLWTMRPRPSGNRPAPRRLVEAGAGPSWSPDGEQIAFGRADGVYIVGRDGSSPRRVAATVPPRPAYLQTDWQPKLWPMRIGGS